MKKSILILIILLSIFTISAQNGNKKYDLSSPQKMIESLNLIGEGTPDYQAISVFYEETAAASINAFDQAVETQRAEFLKFKTYISTNFPSKIKKNTETKLEIKPYDTSYSTISFSFTTTGFIEQFVKFKNGNVKFLSDTIVDNNIQVTANINGKQKTFSVYNENGKYKVKLEQKNIDGLNKALNLLNKTIEILKIFNTRIEKGELNKENFSIVINKWHKELMDIIE